MLKVIAGLVVVVLVALIGFSLIDGNGGDDVTASAAFIAPMQDIAGYARAEGPYAWQFPRDYGAHETFQTEWWYYTGNLAAADGRRFGYQFTIFRRAISPVTSAADDSEFRTSQVYMAHFTLSDIGGERFYHEQRMSRGGVGLAFALPNDSQPDVPYHIALEDWRAQAGDAPDTYVISAQSGEGFGVDFRLTDVKGPILQGDNGLSPKSDEAGNASYYYSQPRLLTEGTIRVGDEEIAVTGTSWMDHEFSTSALGSTALGWDWFGLQFDDGRDLMIGQIRLVGGGGETAFGGLLIEEDGTSRYLPAGSFSITSTGTWTSPHTGATYPSGWRIDITDGPAFDVIPMAADQELHDSDPAYWEGAVRLDNGVTGYGYAELTGYVQPMTNRF